VSYFKQIRRGGIGLALGLLMSTLCLASAQAERIGLPGDINLDGVINVLDVQKAVNMALGVAEPTPEADVTENNLVEVTDVQVVTNTALGVGGLVQDVGGAVNIHNKSVGDHPVRVIAVSSDGRYEEAWVDPVTGEFFLQLGVRTSWSFGFVAETPEGPRALGNLEFPLINRRASNFPLPNLSAGETLELGVIEPEWGTLAPLDLRSLLAAISEPLDTRDFNGDGLSDVLASLFLPLPTSIPGFAFDIFQQLEQHVLVSRIVDCMGEDLARGISPDLSGIETNGVPIFLDPLFSCITGSLDMWLREELNDPLLRTLIPLYVNFFQAWLNTQVHHWLLTLERPELTDTSGNGIPDYLEELLCIVAPEGGSLSDSCLLDPNRSGIPYFIEDSTGNGIPNVLDPEAWVPGDIDGDGIPDHLDIDMDNDGVPNYADADPYDRNVQ